MTSDSDGRAAVRNAIVLWEHVHVVVDDAVDAHLLGQMAGGVHQPALVEQISAVLFDDDDAEVQLLSFEDRYDKVKQTREVRLPITEWDDKGNLFGYYLEM